MTTIEELQEATGYNPDEEGSVDDLIAYKDALEDAYVSALEQLAERKTSTFGSLLEVWRVARRQARNRRAVNMAIKDVRRKGEVR